MSEEQDETSGLDWALAIIGIPLALWGVYTTFIIAGALLDEVVNNHDTVRLVGSVVLAIALPGMAALGVSSKKEKLPPSKWMWRITSAVTIISIGTAAIIGLTMADKVVGTLNNDPNWFMSDPHAQTGPPALNRKYSRAVSHVCGRLAHKAGTYYYPD